MKDITKILEGLLDDDFADKLDDKIMASKKLLWFIKSIAKDQKYHKTADKYHFETLNLDYRKLYGTKNEFMRVADKIGCEDAEAKAAFENNQLIVLYRDGDNGWHSQGFTMWVLLKGKKDVIAKSFRSFITSRRDPIQEANIYRTPIGGAGYNVFAEAIWGKYKSRYIILPQGLWRQCFSDEELKLLGI